MNSEPKLPANVVAAIRSDRKIEAIKLLREQCNMSLKEAKDAVDAYQANGPDFNASRHLDLEQPVNRARENNDLPAVTSDSNSQLPSNVLQAISSNRVSEAIVLLREQRNLGFKEASDIVNAHTKSNPSLSSRRRPRPKSAFRPLAVIILIAIAVYGIFQ